MAYDDYEQGERVQEWLRQNGVAIVVGIVIGLALIFGYRQWNKHQANENIDAATQYQLIQNALDKGKTSEADTLTDSLLKNHADSAYAVFAVSLRAQRQLDAGKADKAVESLTWAVQHADTKPLKDLSRLRLARADLAANKASEALNALKAMPAGAYAGLAAELRGDAQVKLGHADEAVNAYKAAMAAFDPTAPQQRILQMKIDNVATATHAAGKPASHTAAAASSSSSKKQDA
ncbi:MAG TPA: tetratricopeptide repeat protein [Rhodanobacteraceae bacterium]|nr:tetratricopeptide repeat protein [Rhodanobacteraceae bacterium]